MRDKKYHVRKKPFKKVESDKTAEEIAREIKMKASPGGGYREQSLRIHGLICAKCAREFSEKDRHLLSNHMEESPKDPLNHSKKLILPVMMFT